MARATFQCNQFSRDPGELQGARPAGPGGHHGDAHLLRAHLRGGEGRQPGRVHLPPRRPLLGHHHHDLGYPHHQHHRHHQYHFLSHLHPSPSSSAPFPNHHLPPPRALLQFPHHLLPRWAMVILHPRPGLVRSSSPPHFSSFGH